MLTESPLKPFPAMLPDATRPVAASLIALLAVLAPLFTAQPLRMFRGLVCGFLAQPGRRIVALLVPDGEPVGVAPDHTLFRGGGSKVWAAETSEHGAH